MDSQSDAGICPTVGRRISFRQDVNFLSVIFDEPTPNSCHGWTKARNHILTLQAGDANLDTCRSPIGHIHNPLF